MTKHKNSLRMFELMDELNDCQEDMTYHIIVKKTNRLHYLEKNAVKIEKIAIEMQQLVKEMQRN